MILAPPFQWYQSRSALDAAAVCADPDPYWASVIYLAVNDNQADGTTTFTDQSSYARALTAVGGAQYDTAQAPTGMTSSVSLDGTDDKITGAYGAEQALTTQDFTFEARARWSDVSGLQGIINMRTNPNNYTSMSIVNSGGNVSYYASSNGSSWDVASNQVVGTVVAGQWYHIAVTRSGSTWRAFLEGTKNASELTSSASLYDGGEGTALGGIGQYEINGWIASARITVGVARWTANFTPPTLPLQTCG